MVAGVDLPIHLRDRIETLETRIALVRWQTLDGRADETIFEGLHEPQFVSFQWTAECQSRSESFDSNPFATAPSKPRKKALRLDIEFVGAGTR
jgi:hypothetical protein